MLDPPAPDDITVVKDYLLLGTLGSGSFGKVRLGIHRRTGQKVAVKIINKRRMMHVGLLNKLGREIRAMSGTRHPHVIYIHELIDTTSTVFIVMEYVEGGELFDYVSHNPRLSEYEAIRLLRQILSAVDFCHNHMICHRDIKPENILLDDKLNVKLGDFGLSNFMREGECLKTPCGSPNYASPEVICGKAYSGPEVDIWSCGIIFYALLCSSLPFDDDEMSILFNKIKVGTFHIPGYISKEAKWVLQRMLDVNPASRITMRELLRHPWFAGCNQVEDSLKPVEYTPDGGSVELPYHACGSTVPGEQDSLTTPKPGGVDAEVANSLALKFKHYSPRWSIGVSGFTSEEQCLQKLTETLKGLRYKWRFLPGYKLYCIRDDALAESASPQFSIQLYKMKHKCYMVDVKLCKGKILPSLEEGIKIKDALEQSLIDSLSLNL